jgi:hypothetical protein
VAALPDALLAASPVTIRTAVRAVRRHSAEPARPNSAARPPVPAAGTKRKSPAMRGFLFTNGQPPPHITLVNCRSGSITLIEEAHRSHPLRGPIATPRDRFLACHDLLNAEVIARFGEGLSTPAAVDVLPGWVERRHGQRQGRGPLCGGRPELPSRRTGFAFDPADIQPPAPCVLSGSAETCAGRGIVLSHLQSGQRRRGWRINQIVSGGRRECEGFRCWQKAHKPDSGTRGIDDNGEA